MKLSELKPLHGWRAFFGEVGVVVLGVLLALGAQEIVQEVQERSDERAFRETIDHEIGLNLFMYQVRGRQFDCDAKRADELKQWLAEARTGAPVPPITRAAPNIITPYRSAWDTRDANVFNHLAPKIRQKYAEFYDELSNNWTIMKSEDQAWDRLWSYAEPGPLSLSDRREIRVLIGQVRGSNQLLETNFPISRDIARVLKIKPARPDGLPDEWLARLDICSSVIAQSS